VWRRREREGGGERETGESSDDMKEYSIFLREMQAHPNASI